MKGRLWVLNDNTSGSCCRMTGATRVRLSICFLRVVHAGADDDALCNTG